MRVGTGKCPIVVNIYHDHHDLSLANLVTATCGYSEFSNHQRNVYVIAGIIVAGVLFDKRLQMIQSLE